MALTAEQANALLGSITTQEQLRDLINRLDINSGGSTTVLYSGNTVNGLDNSQILQGMLHNGDAIWGSDYAATLYSPQRRYMLQTAVSDL